MTEAPPYFEDVRASAARRWGQLEQDPVLAGPWHQLFKQVQSPRHVVSELLQNADDAGATAASVDIQDGEFVFTHNGEDFTEEHFTSLCRFGYSNKRSLHTIGFRGIGFKSTFSIGDEVRLRTPSLSVAFRRSRFTEPMWVARDRISAQHTEVRVAILDSHRLKELKKNLDDWITSPASLLFFRSIRCLTIGGSEIRWEAQGPGPVPGSNWLSLSGTPNRRVLLIQSSPEPFPDEALEEIRQERMVAVDEATAFPPCSVELVLGLEGRMFVILPTGVMTKLPFACNAPFIQDPARVKIKDPETSPTNRWLLGRVGQLVADSMLSWVGQAEAGIEERAEAYALLPSLDPDDHSLEGNCGRIVEDACKSGLKGSSFLLLEDGSLARENACVAVPRVLLDVWSTDLVSHFFTERTRPVLSRFISSENLKKLIKWNIVGQVKKDDVLAVLKTKHLRKPDSWTQLLLLWSYVSENLLGYYYFRIHKDICILPVQGKDVLYGSNEIVRLGEKKLLQSQEDWQFLAKYLLVLNQNWPRFLAEQRRRAEQEKNEVLGEQVEIAYKIFDAVNLGQASDASQVVEQVARKVFDQEDCSLSVCVRLAQLAAALGAIVSNDFQFVTRDGQRTPASQHVVADLAGDLDTFVPEKWHEKHVLHEDYGRFFNSCSRDEWMQWVKSGRGRLLTFVPFVGSSNKIFGRDKFLRFLRSRGVTETPDYPYRSHEFHVEEIDFPPAIWKHWKDKAENDPELWGRLMARILEQPADSLEKAMVVTAIQVATNGHSRQVACKNIRPGWINLFRSFRCLQDTNGHYREPAELLYRTPETDPLFGVEAFVRTEHDTERTRPLLIKLGARGIPTGPQRLLDRLRALATVDNPPVYEVEKWCRRLDQLLNKCATPEFNEIKTAFSDEKLILSSEAEWVKMSEVFLAADEDDAPGSALVHSAVHDLSMWRKIGVADRPTSDLTIRWLSSIPSGKKLSKDELRRVRALLPRYPERIWRECGHWLNLEGEWVPVGQLSYKLTMQALIPWANLFQPVKQSTADLQKLTTEMCGQYPFEGLLNLADCIEDRFDERLGNSTEPIQKPWLVAFGNGLARIQLDDPTETDRIQNLGQGLANTKCRLVSLLNVTPYIDGSPSGVPRRVEVLWKDRTLYLENKSVAKMAKAVALELGRHFGRADIADAIKLCFERDRNFIDEYIEENFKLLPLTSTTARLDDQSHIEPQEEPAEEKRPDAGQAPSFPPCKGDDEPVEEATEEPRSDDLGGDFVEKPSEADLVDDGEDDETDVCTPREHPQRPARPKLIERYASANGFTKDSSGIRFYRGDGGWLDHASGVSFPWERYSPSGELLQCYWVKDHCIEREPLQIEADVWELCVKHPEKYSLLLAAPDGTPVEYSGKQLCVLRDSGEVKLFAASYRLVYEQDQVKEESDE